MRTTSSRMFSGCLTETMNCLQTPPAQLVFGFGNVPAFNSRTMFWSIIAAGILKVLVVASYGNGLPGVRPRLVSSKVYPVLPGTLGTIGHVDWSSFLKFEP